MRETLDAMKEKLASMSKKQHIALASGVVAVVIAGVGGVSLWTLGGPGTTAHVHPDPSATVTVEATEQPSADPTVEPSGLPTADPTQEPLATPTPKPVATEKPAVTLRPVVTPKPTTKPVNTPPPVVDDNPYHYSCGVANHHCMSESEHALITRYENQGCKFCGSHSCPSFYAVNQWGGAYVDGTLCPQYSAHKDPSKYCQTCGKPKGDGSNGTCNTFNQSMNCPNCGEWVEAWVCHTCK